MERAKSRKINSMEMLARWNDNMFTWSLNQIGRDIGLEIMIAFPVIN